VTVREASDWARGLLSGTPSPLADAHLLLCSLRNWERHEVFLNAGSTLSPGELEEFSAMVRRRASREPLQHITGRTGFMGREFLCGPSALVPRHETEILVETITGRIGGDPGLLIDVGTGSGVVAICLALEYPDALVIGTDVSPGALELARENLDVHRPRNLSLVAADMLGAFRTGGRGSADALAANLPYVPSSDVGTLQPEVSLWDPTVALDGGPDGLELVSRLIGDAVRHLRPGGLLAFEVGPGQAGRAAGMLSSNTGFWTDLAVTRDLSGCERVVSAVRTGREP
jgi:release factor glutamine methyltransferase